jgi:HAD superfamily hydrolase (TIGR01484 family)
VAARAVTLRALATDYDGTLACDGVTDEPTIDALMQARSAGIHLLLVTGRELPSLFNTFAHTSLFDRVVAENGAVLYTPETTAIESLADAPPPVLLTALADAKVPFSVGHAIVASWRPHDVTIRRIIEELELPWDLIFNKQAVMVLPSGVTKATGLTHALRAIGVPACATIGVGDAENDHAFLRECGVSAAVANALPSVKDAVDVVTTGTRGEGVREVIARALAHDFDSISGREDGCAERD